MSTGSRKIMSLGSGAWPEGEAKNVIAISEPSLYNVGSSTSHNPIGLHGLFQG
jgi:hypothetical protein